MTWTKIGHEWEKKSERLSVPAALAHFELLMLSNDRDLDLLVPYDLLHRLAHPVTSAVIAELVAAELWEDVPPLIDADDEVVEPAAIRCLFHPEWQLKAHVVEHQRKQAALRQERKRNHAIGDHSICTERCAVIKRSHDRGQHDLCEASPYATCSEPDPDDTRDVTRDDTSDDTSDPARTRFGSARPRLTSTNRQEEKELPRAPAREETATSSESLCVKCGQTSTFPLIAGYCRRELCDKSRRAA